MNHIQNHECFNNVKTGEVRATFMLGATFYVVVKFFRTDSEVFSVKVWSGDYEKTKSYWNTDNPVNPDKAKIFFALGRDHISKFANILAPLQKLESDGDK